MSKSSVSLGLSGKFRFVGTFQYSSIISFNHGLIDYRLLVETTCCPETVYKQNVLLTTVFTGRRDEWICVIRAAAAEKNDKGR